MKALCAGGAGCKATCSRSREGQERCLRWQPAVRGAWPIVKPQTKPPFLHSWLGQPRAQNPKPLLKIYYGWEMEHAQKCVFTQILVWSQLGNSHKLLRKSVAAVSWPFLPQQKILLFIQSQSSHVSEFLQYKIQKMLLKVEKVKS